MRIRLACCVLAISLAACLSSPDPATIDAGAGEDAMMNACGNRDDFTPMAFPPVGIEIGIRHIHPADINLDGAVDLILTNADVPDEDFGFFVLLGPQSDASNLVYHAFVPTGAAPHALTVHDIMGEPCPEVTIYGRAKVVATGYAEVYGNVGAPSLLDPIPVRKDVGYQPSNDDAPVHAVYAALDGDGLQNDLVVGDLDTIRVMHTAGTDFASELAVATPVVVGRDGSSTTFWADINAIVPRRSPTDPDVDDLLIIELNTYTWLINDGSGGFDGPTHVSLDNNYVFSAFGVAEVDYDGTDPIDIIGAGGTGFGGYLVAQTDSVAPPTTFEWFGEMPSTDGEMDDVLVADLGGGDQPEVILLDYHATAGSAAHLIDDTFVSNQEALPTTVYTHDFVGANPKNGAIANFNGSQGPEVWAFDPNGSARCLERDPAMPQLRLCQ